MRAAGAPGTAGAGFRAEDPHVKRHADCDLIHDEDTDVSEIHFDLTDEQTEAARILGLGRRLTPAQWRTVQELCEWRNRRTEKSA